MIMMKTFLRIDRDELEKQLISKYTSKGYVVSKRKSNDYFLLFMARNFEGNIFRIHLYMLYDGNRMTEIYSKECSHYITSIPSYNDAEKIMNKLTEIYAEMNGIEESA